MKNLSKQEQNKTALKGRQPLLRDIFIKTTMKTMMLFLTLFSLIQVQKNREREKKKKSGSRRLSPLQKQNNKRDINYELSLMHQKQKNPNSSLENIFEQTFNKCQSPRNMNRNRNATNNTQEKDPFDQKILEYQNIRIKNHLIPSLMPGEIFQMKFIVDQSCCKYLWTQFTGNSYESSEFIINAKKVSILPTTTYVITSKQGHFQEKSPDYLCKIKTNVFGDVLNVYGPPQEDQIKATIVYQTTILPTGIPRRFKVYVKRSPYLSYDHIPERRLGQEVPLHKLYENQKNKDKIDVYSNKKPYFIEGCNAYMLNLGEKVKKESVRNFILEGENKTQVMLFGREKGNEYYLKIESPLSPLLGFAIALSNFTSRLIGQ